MAENTFKPDNINEKMYDQYEYANFCLAYQESINLQDLNKQIAYVEI